MTTSLSVLGEQVSKVALKEGPANSGAPSGAGKPWGLLGDIWKQASDVTGELARVIATQDLEDTEFYKFPRPEGAPPPTSARPNPASTGLGQSTTSREGSRDSLQGSSAGAGTPSRNTSSSSLRRMKKEEDEWDDLDGLSLYLSLLSPRFSLYHSVSFSSLFPLFLPSILYLTRGHRVHRQVTRRLLRLLRTHPLEAAGEAARIVLCLLLHHP